MKITKIQGTCLALIAVALFAAAIGHPIVPMESLTLLGGVPLMLGETSIVEIKTLIEAQGRAWEEHKKTNDEILKAKAEGKAVADLEVKLAKIAADLDSLSESKRMIEDFMAKATAPGGGAEKTESFEAEVKMFNANLLAHRQAKGLAPAPAFDGDGYKHFKSAFVKMVRTGSIDALSADERKAMIAGSDPDGGFLLPPTAQGKMVTKLFEQSLMRQIADVQTISGPAIEGLVDNNEADAGWVGEVAARTDTNTPQVGKWRIEAFEMYAAPKASQTLLDDSVVDVEAWLAGKVADKFGRVEGTAFWQGTGAGQPRGLCSYTTAATADGTRAWGQFEHVKSGANGAFHTDKFDAIHSLMGTIKDHFLPNAQFVMRRSVRTAARKIKEATTDRYMWEPSLQMGQPERLMGYPARVDEYMPALATDSLSLAFGDFRQAYQIVDRIGVRVLRDPYTSKPYVIFYTTKRTGGGAMNFEAVKFLKFAA